ncbi:hypothetical protein FRC06_009163, partial [Ceratobasidium sp. 370]
MTSPPPPHTPSGRKRFPSSRFKKYELAALEAAERGKKQSAIAAAHGNTTLPGPQKPLTATTRDSDQEGEDVDELGDDEGDGNGNGNGDGDGYDDDEDDEAGPPLLDSQLEDLISQVDRIEWLCQTIKRLGVHHNYRDDPHFQDEGSLHKEWRHLVTNGSKAPAGAPIPGKFCCIQTGQTHVLKPQTSGCSSRNKLTRMDDQTIGPDSVRAGAHDTGGHGRPPLSHTNKTTIGLDSMVVSPRTDARRENAISTSIPCPTQPAPLKRTHSDDPTPSKKKAVIPLPRIQVLRKQYAKSGGEAPAGESSASSVKPSKPAPPPCHLPPRDSEMQDPPSDNEHPPTPNIHQQDPPPTPPTDDDQSLDGNGEGLAQQTAADGQGDQAGAAGDAKLTKRQQAQLRAFPPEVVEVVQWVTERIKVDAITKCAFTECMTKELGDQKTMQQGSRDGKVPVPLKDTNATYIQSHFYTIRNSMKKSAIPLVIVYFGLRRSDHNVAATAHSLTDGGNEHWLSPDKKDGHLVFKNQAIADLIETEYFKTSRSFGFKHIDDFTPLVPIPLIAFACAILRNCIKSFEVEPNKGADLDATKDKEAFIMYMEMLEEIQRDDPIHLLDIQMMIMEQYLQAWPKPATLPVPEMNLACHTSMDMERLQWFQDMFGKDAPGMEEWDGVKDVQRKGKGKGPMTGGPSAS